MADSDKGSMRASEIESLLRANEVEYFEGVSEHGARVDFVVHQGTVTSATSSTHPCFRALSVGQPWGEVRKEYEARGFTIHGGH